MKNTVVVAGLGRCGTSMVMQMLAAAGCPVLGRSPGFEVDEAMGRITPEISASWEGHAVKVLDPQRLGLPVRCKVVWLDRDVREQAKSQLKLMAAVQSVSVSRGSRRKLQVMLEKDRIRAMAVVTRHPLLRLRFEEILEAPTAAAQKLADFTELPGFHVPGAAGRVLKRSAPCRDGLGIELGLLQP